MKKNRFVPVIYSLAIGSIMVFTSPAQSATITYQGIAGGSLPTVGYTFTVKGISGRPVNFTSIKSSIFPLTPIENNNTSEVSISLLGSALQPGKPYTLELETEDNPNGATGFNFDEVKAFFGTPTGIQEQIIPALSIASSTSAEAKTPFSAVQVTIPGDSNDAVIERNDIYQLPGAQINFTPYSFSEPVVLNISTLPISEYLPLNEIQQLVFPPPQEYTFVPGGSVSVGVVAAAVPEPQPFTIVGLLSAISLGALSKALAKKKMSHRIQGIVAR